jgi:hypothetical protein
MGLSAVASIMGLSAVVIITAASSSNLSRSFTLATPAATGAALGTRHATDMLQFHRGAKDTQHLLHAEYSTTGAGHNATALQMVVTRRAALLQVLVTTLATLLQVVVTRRAALLQVLVTTLATLLQVVVTRRANLLKVLVTTLASQCASHPSSMYSIQLSSSRDHCGQGYGLDLISLN